MGSFQSSFRLFYVKTSFGQSKLHFFKLCRLASDIRENLCTRNSRFEHIETIAYIQLFW